MASLDSRIYERAIRMLQRTPPRSLPALCVLVEADELATVKTRGEVVARFADVPPLASRVRSFPVPAGAVLAVFVDEHEGVSLERLTVNPSTKPTKKAGQ